MRSIYLHSLLLFLWCCPTLFAQSNSDATGLVWHITHFPDLILEQAENPGAKQIAAFKEITHKLEVGIANRALSNVNEKIDGSPSIVIGFDKLDRPFVAYKGELDSENESSRSRPRSRQVLIRTELEARREFEDRPALAEIYASIIRNIAPRLRSLRDTIGPNYLFQGDLLFSDGDRRRKKEGDCYSIKPNVVEYRVCPGNALFRAISSAKIGVVLHSVGKRIIGEDGRVYESMIDSRDILETFVDKFKSPNVFAITPLRRNVQLSSELSFDLEKQSSISSRILEIEDHMNSLSSPFKKRWKSFHHEQFRVFFNSALYPGGDGGIYKEAAEGLPLNVQKWLNDYDSWLSIRIKKKNNDEKAQKILNIVSEERESLGPDFINLISAYFKAIEIQYKLAPYFSEVFSTSKLGEGQIEGLILETDAIKVKWVDRLNFTRMNFSFKPHEYSLEDLKAFPAPFNEWRPDSIFVIMKGQPFHSGHIAMVDTVLKQFPNRHVVVIASSKEPQLRATNYRELGAAETKAKTASGDYSHAYNRKVRAEILRLGLPEGVPFYLLNPSLFRSYLGIVHALNLPGTVYMALGEKEMEASRFEDDFARYAPHVEPIYVPMQNDGISGTEVRKAIASLTTRSRNKPEDAVEVLDSAMSMIKNPVDRKLICEELIRQHRALDRVATKLTTKHK